MAVAGCPHCRANLRINPDFAGQTLQCPNCGNAFIAPNVDQVELEEDEEFPLSAIVACVGGAHIVLLLVLAIATSPISAFVLVGFLILIELSVWKRQELMANFQRVQESETTRQILEQAKSRVVNGAETAHSFLSQPRTSPKRSEIVTAEVVGEVDDGLVEIRPAKPAQSSPRTVSRIRQPEPRQERPSMWGELRGWPLEAKLPKDNVYFYGPGSELPTSNAPVSTAVAAATPNATARLIRQ